MIRQISATIPAFFGIIFFYLFVGVVYGQPSNDNCFGATSLTPSSTCVPVSGTVANASQSIPGCTGTADDDVWYSFVANQSSLGIQVTGGTGFNPVIQVFSGGCSSSSSLICSNNSTSTTETATISTLIVGITYWVRVYSFGATYPANPTFTICISPQAMIPPCSTSTPAGNTCDVAALICTVDGYCGSTAASYTSNSWASLSSAFCGSIENNSFIQFVANSSTVSLNVWVTSSSSNLGIQVMIFSTTSCGGTVTPHVCVSPLAPSSAPSSVTATGLIPGNTYYMMIDGFAGDVCNYVIGVNSGIQISGQITTSTTNVCLGSPVTLTASGGDGNYIWNPSPDLNTTTGSVVVASPTTQGAHTYTMSTGSNNPMCPANSFDITINAFAPPTPNAGIDDTVCLGSPIFLNGIQTSTANTMSWSFLTTGISPTPTVSFSPNFSSLTPTVTVNQPGLYRFILRETNSVCGINRDTVKVLVLNPQQTTSIIEPSCFGLSDGEIHITNMGASEFSFNNGTSWQTESFMVGFSAGTYSVCSRNYLGCSVCTEAIIENPDQIELEVSNDTLICENGTATLQGIASGGLSFLYHWDFTTDNGATQIVNPTNNSSYSVYAENENGCISETEIINVNVRPSISGTITPNSAICPYYPIDIDADASGGNNGPYLFSWSTGENNNGLNSVITVSPTVTTTYTVTITDQCESTPLILSTEVEVLPLPIPLISTMDPAICEPAVFTINNTTDPSMVGNLYWEVSNGDIFVNQESITTNPLSAGNYSLQLIVTSPQGCVDSMTFNNFLTVYPKPEAIFTYSPNPVLMFNTNVQLTNYTLNGENYQWYIEDGNPYYSEQKNVKTKLPDGVTGQYEVMLIAISDFGCIDTAIQIINVVPEILLYAPNSFTPDGNDYNQQWGIYMEGLDIYNFELILFNRWGQIIWESHDPNTKWDGTYNGVLVQQGTYTWTIEAKDIQNDAKYNFNGHVNVLR